MTLIFPTPPGLGALPFQPPTPPEGLDLSDWREFDSQFTVAAALKLNIPGVAEMASNGQGIIGIRQTRRSGRVPTEDGGYDIFGVSVSLLVHAQGASLTTDTGIAAISAHVELKEASATSTFEVLGFDEPGLWNVLKSMPSLDVDSFAKCVEGMNAAKEYIGDHPANQKVEFLGHQPAPDTSDADLRRALVTGLLVRYVAAGSSLADMLSRSRGLTQDDQSVARTAWGMLMPEATDDTEPSNVAVARAKDAIGGLPR